MSCRYGSMSCRILDRPVLFGLSHLSGNFLSVRKAIDEKGIFVDIKYQVRYNMITLCIHTNLDGTVLFPK